MYEYWDLCMSDLSGSGWKTLQQKMRRLQFWRMLVGNILLWSSLHELQLCWCFTFCRSTSKTSKFTGFFYLSLEVNIHTLCTTEPKAGYPPVLSKLSSKHHEEVLGCESRETARDGRGGEVVGSNRHEQRRRDDTRRSVIKLLLLRAFSWPMSACSAMLVKKNSISYFFFWEIIAICYHSFGSLYCRCWNIFSINYLMEGILFGFVCVLSSFLLFF